MLSAAGAFGGGESWVRARWQAPGGARRSGQILATTGLRAGSTVTIWTNSAGEIASPPLQPSQITSRAIAVAALGRRLDGRGPAVDPQPAVARPAFGSV